MGCQQVFVNTGLGWLLRAKHTHAAAAHTSSHISHWVRDLMLPAGAERVACFGHEQFTPTGRKPEAVEHAANHVPDALLRIVCALEHGHTCAQRMLKPLSPECAVTGMNRCERAHAHARPWEDAGRSCSGLKCLTRASIPPGIFGTLHLAHVLQTCTPCNRHVTHFSRRTGLILTGLSPLTLHRHTMPPITLANTGFQTTST